MAQSKEQRLWQACTDGDLEVARKLADDPAVDVNWEIQIMEEPRFTVHVVMAGPVSWNI